MGQEADSRRNASLDEKKERAAGRMGRTGQNAPGRDAIAEPPARSAGGAFGADGKANREDTATSQGAGGGGGGPAPASANDFNTGAAKRGGRKRST